jgi:hypothetical protein
LHSSTLDLSQLWIGSLSTLDVTSLSSILDLHDAVNNHTEEEREAKNEEDAATESNGKGNNNGDDLTVPVHDHKAYKRKQRYSFPRSSRAGGKGSDYFSHKRIVMQICYAAKLLVPSARRQSRCRTSAWAACLAFRFANRRWSRKALLPLRPRFIFEANTMHTLHVQLILALRSCNSSCNYSNIVLLLYFHFFQIALCTLLPKKLQPTHSKLGRVHRVTFGLAF